MAVVPATGKNDYSRVSVDIFPVILAFTGHIKGGRVQNPPPLNVSVRHTEQRTG